QLQQRRAAADGRAHLGAAARVLLGEDPLPQVALGEQLVGGDVECGGRRGGEADDKRLGRAGKGEAALEALVVGELRGLFQAHRAGRGADEVELGPAGGGGGVVWGAGGGEGRVFRSHWAVRTEAGCSPPPPPPPPPSPPPRPPNRPP